MRAGVVDVIRIITAFLIVHNSGCSGRSVLGSSKLGLREGSSEDSVGVRLGRWTIRRLVLVGEDNQERVETRESPTRGLAEILVKLVDHGNSLVSPWDLARQLVKGTTQCREIHGAAWRVRLKRGLEPRDLRRVELPVSGLDEILSPVGGCTDFSFSNGSRSISCSQLRLRRRSTMTSVQQTSTLLMPPSSSFGSVSSSSSAAGSSPSGGGECSSTLGSAIGSAVEGAATTGSAGLIAESVVTGSAA